MNSSLDRLREIVARLRSPDGCPWDREQTHESLKPHLLEECYEVIDSIDSKNDTELKEELGDILLQVVLHSQIAAEDFRFDFDEVASLIAEKLVHRHPHVFGTNRLPDSEAVLQQWDSLKRLEKANRQSILDGVPKALPALARAQKLQTKAARVGFDWSDADGAWRKVLEEVNEVAAASNDELAEEIGDLLFAIVNFVRKNKLDAEQILNRATKKFHDRFREMERLASERDLDFVRLSLDQMEQLWSEAKK